MSGLIKIDTGNGKKEGTTMKKKGIIALAAALCVALFAQTALAVQVSTADDLTSAIASGGEITLTNDITITTRIEVEKDIDLDLAGHIIDASLDGNDIFLVTSGATMTVNDSVGGGKISSEGDAGIQVQGNMADADGDAVNSKLVLKGGTIEADFYPVSVLGKGAQFDIYGGTVQVTAVDGFAVSGSAGKTVNHGTIINIYGGELIGGTGLESDNSYYNGTGRDYVCGAGVYHPQRGTVTMTGGTVSGYVGMEFKGGTLNMTGGTIISTGAMPDDPIPTSTDGATAIGAAVAFLTQGGGYGGEMAASISGTATLEASGNNSVALYEGINTTSTAVAESDVSEIKISGGEFYGAASALSLVSISTDNVSITGGEYSSDISKYLADGASMSMNAEGNYVIVSNPAEDFDIDETAIEEYLVGETLQLEVGQTLTIPVTMTPADSDDVIVWTTSDENVATVDESGIVTAVGAGTVTITGTITQADGTMLSDEIIFTVVETSEETDEGTDEGTDDNKGSGGGGGGCSAGFGAYALLAVAILPILRMRKK